MQSLRRANYALEPMHARSMSFVLQHALLKNEGSRTMTAGSAIVALMMLGALLTSLVFSDVAGAERQ